MDGHLEILSNSWNQNRKWNNGIPITVKEEGID